MPIIQHFYQLIKNNENRGMINDLLSKILVVGPTSKKKKKGINFSAFKPLKIIILKQKKNKTFSL